MKKKAIAILMSAVFLFPYIPAVKAVSPMIDVLVLFKGDINEKVIEKMGGDIESSYRYVPAVKASIPTSAISILQNNKEISSVTENKPVTFTQEENQWKNWGAPIVGATSAWTIALNGAGVKVGVLDTGISTQHPALRTNIKAAVNCIGDGNCKTSDVEDIEGHGTHVAGIIGATSNTIMTQGVAPGVSLYSIKIMSETQNGEAVAYNSDIVRGIEYAMTQKLDIINMSLGSSISDPVIESVIKKAYLGDSTTGRKGMLIVAAAGNKDEGDLDSLSYPAAYSDYVISVGSIKSDKTRSAFSQGGPTLEVVAPGEMIVSTYIPVSGSVDQYAVMDGTSMATPFVAGVLALYKQAYPTETNVQIRKRMQGSALDLGVKGRDDMFGYGLVQAPKPTPVTAPVVKPVVTPVITKTLTTFEPLTLYKTAATTTKSGKTLIAGEYTYTQVSSGWYKFKTSYGELWAKPLLYYNGKLPATSGKLKLAEYTYLYGVPNVSTVTKGALKPTTVSYTKKWGNWYYVNTYAGLQWVTIPTKLVDKIRLNANTSLYASPIAKASGTIKPGTYVTMQQLQGGWIQIKTTAGVKWIKQPAPMLESKIVKKEQWVTFSKVTSFYDYPISGLKAKGSVKPSRLKSYESWNGWVHIHTWLGDKWFKV